MRILITGAGGQLGQCLVPALADHEVIALGHSALDLTRLEAVREAVGAARPTIAINAAAFNDVDGAESRSIEAYAVNALAPRNLALATAELGIPIVHVSTDYVFDGAAGRPYHEFDRVNPLSVYGASKLAGEEAVRALNPRHYIVRTAWLFWERGRNFLRAMHANAGRAELRATCDQFGSPTYVPYLARAIARLIPTSAFGTWHMAGRGVASRFDMVTTLFAALEIRTTLRPVSRSEFPAAAERPIYSELATLQEPRIELPEWREGILEFARRIS